MERVIHLVRHGHYIRDPERRDFGHLSSMGRRQALAAGRHLATWPIGKLISSTMTRAVETADCIASVVPGVPRQRRRLLDEGLFGLMRTDLHGPPLARNRSRNLRARLWRDPDARQRAVARIDDSGRRWRDHQRAMNVARELFQPAGRSDEHLAVVCHGNLIRYLVCIALEADPALWSGLASSNGAISRLHVLDDGEVVVGCHNDTGFLRPGLRSE